MNKTTLLATVVGLFLVGGFANASDIGPAGCGLGNSVMGKDSQVLASTTNGTSGNQTFGISSGTSNCVESGSNAQLLNYIHTNQVALTREAARGEGDTIAGLATIFGCKDTHAFGSAMKRNYEKLFPSQDVNSSQVTIQLKQIMSSDAQLAKQCPIG